MRFTFLLLIVTSLVTGQRTTPIDNDQVRVLSVVDTPGPRGRMHEHSMNRVMIYLDTGGQRIAYQDGRVTDLKFKPGQVVWSPSGGMHTSENTGGKPYRIVEIELKGQPKTFQPPMLDPVRVYPAGYKVELDNAQIRVIRVHMDAHAKVPLHEHALNRVIVFLKPQKLRVTPEAGASTELSATENEVRFSPPARHAEENLGDGPFEALVVELK